MRILVLGGYGMIGLAVAQALLRAGHQVTGLGRSAAKGRAHLPEADWIGADISRLTTPVAWAAHLAGIDAVVNASGALQDSARDRLQDTQSRAIIALVQACETAKVSRFIQISAPGATAASDTAFYRTKAQADTALKASPLDWTILRPGVVIAPTAYGGTALLRMLAAFPLVQPLVLADAKIQTVAMDDLADAAVACVNGAHIGVDADLIEETPHTLADIVAQVRAWLGFAPARVTLQLPCALGYGVAKFADLAGWFGWRSPLRTTALRVLESGVAGDPNVWLDSGGGRLKTLPQTLADLPATRQERIFARSQLVFPVLVLTLALFWLASGLIGLWQADAARAVLGDSLPPAIASAAVIGGGITDIAIGGALLFRRWLRPACFASVAVAFSYILGGTFLTPHLWADPLGPFVKVFPAIALSLAVAALAEER